MGIEFYVPEMNFYVRAFGRAVKKNEKARYLADYCRKSRAADSEIERKNKQRIKKNVQHRTADKPDHGVKSRALKTELIIYD